MASRVVASGLLFLLCCCGLGDKAKGRNLSLEEHAEMEKQLKYVKKQAIKTIQNKNGDIIDCININQQLAFDHPLLKNHSILQNFSFHKDGNNERLISDALYSMSDLGERCPPGTIPIRRTKKDEIIGLKSFLKSAGKSSNLLQPLGSTPSPGVHWAILQSNEGKYLGASAWLNICGLQGVKREQFSQTVITILNGIIGPSQNYNVIQVGWMVNPMLYGDLQTRLTVFWTTDGYQTVHCYNQLCPGFVHVSAKIALGSVLGDQGDDKFLSFFIYKDGVTGDWCFTMETLTGVENIGYWPKSIFSSLSDHASLIQWGGVAFSPANEKSPPMGNGKFPSNGGARVIKIQMINENGHIQEPKGDALFYADKPECYVTSKLSKDEAAGQFFSFGGPGGCIG